MNHIPLRFIAIGHKASYWHSENVTCYVTIDRCPSCTFKHDVVVLYVDEEHREFEPHDYLIDVLLPCGARVDIILERTGA